MTAWDYCFIALTIQISMVSNDDQDLLGGPDLGNNF